jgi:polyhydroxyalkanoate synthase
MPAQRTNARSAAAATPPHAAPSPGLDVAAGWQQAMSGWQQALAQWRDWWLAPRTSPEGHRTSGPATATSAATGHLPFDPARMLELNQRFAARAEALWNALQSATAAGGGAPLAEVVPASRGDRRFAGPAWHAQPWFSFLRQGYLLYADYLTALAALAELPPADQQRLQFITRQYVDAIAPTNFPATNPDVIARAIETEGASLTRGLANLAQDMARGRITMSDESAFEVGRNLAVTPGSVVFRNDLIELIQYEATTPTVHRRPLVMVPPCINKYYILDLTPANSLVRHAVAQGHTTFMLSWRNIPPGLGSLTWDDYLEQGPLAAFRVVQEICGSREVDALGFCVGGTILACALAVLAARGDDCVTSVTLLTTMLDFAQPGEIGVYIAPEGLAATRPAFCAGARMPGSDLAGAFATLRPNELVWNYVVDNYLKGRTPPPFDLLYWNADSASLPGPMYAYYLEEMYVANRLREPGALTMLDVPIDLGRIRAPAYVYASRDDHIVPWRSAYRTTGLLGGDVTFVLGASGHIAGVINPPEAHKRSYWTHPSLPADPAAWLGGAHEHAGSWWPDWDRWLASHAGARRKARKVGNARHPPLTPAPGQYVLDRSA